MMGFFITVLPLAYRKQYLLEHRYKSMQEDHQHFWT